MVCVLRAACCATRCRCVQVGRLSWMSRAARVPLLLLLRHGVGASSSGIVDKDPSDVAWFASRDAFDALCPDGAGCLHGRRARDVHAQGCGHPYVTLLVHAPSRLRLHTFFVPPGAPPHRPHQSHFHQLRAEVTRRDG
jgi:hypothetical protein